MALQLADRVQQTGSANTTVSFNLSATVAGYQSFSSAITTGNTTYYAASDGTNWEVGIGTLTSSILLTRTTILSSSNSGSAVSTFGATVTIFVTQPAGNTVVSSNNPGTSGYVLASNGSGVAPSWQAVGNAYTRTSFTATAGQTTFTVSYTVGYVEVYVNGVLLNGADYTASNGTSVVLAQGRATGDIVETIAFATGTVTPTNLSVGTSLVQGGTNGYVLYNNSGVVGNLATTGSGSVVLGTSPTLSSPTFSGNPTGVGVLTSGTAVASTSGTSIDFTSLPSWIKRITVLFNGVSTNGASPVLIQLGYSGGIINTGYLANSTYLYTAGIRGQYTTGFGSAYTSSVNVRNGITTICNINGNTWIASGVLGDYADNATVQLAGVVTLTGTLDRIRVTTVNGTDTFDAGSINILYE
jgi:hypothetical protein